MRTISFSEAGNIGEGLRVIKLSYNSHSVVGLGVGWWGFGVSEDADYADSGRFTRTKRI